MKKPINWKNDPKTWLHHTLYMMAVYLVLSVVASPEVGVAVACTVIYMREVVHGGAVFEFWLWKSWDSILDFVVPVIVVVLSYNFLTPIIKDLL